MMDGADEDCGACDNLQQLSALTGNAAFSDIKKTKKRRKKKKTKQQTPTGTKIEENEGKEDKLEDDIIMDRPINFEELGNSTWNLIHTMAAYYPEKPTEIKQKATIQFVKGLGDVYPCTHCATDWKDEIKDHPPRVDSRSEFSQWACEIHNVINDKLGKDIFPCSKVDARWRFDPTQQEKLYESNE